MQVLHVKISHSMSGLLAEHADVMHWQLEIHLPFYTVRLEVMVSAICGTDGHFIPRAFLLGDCEQ